MMRAAGAKLPSVHCWRPVVLAGSLARWAVSSRRRRSNESGEIAREQAQTCSPRTYRAVAEMPPIGRVDPSPVNWRDASHRRAGAFADGRRAHVTGKSVADRVAGKRADGPDDFPSSYKLYGLTSRKSPVLVSFRNVTLASRDAFARLCPGRLRRRALWNEIGPEVATSLLREPAAYATVWIEAQRPVGPECGLH
jgi:hypothetical protein